MKIKQTLKRGVYETIYGNSAVVTNGLAKTAFDLDEGKKIPIELVTAKFLRKVEQSDLEQRAGY